MPQALFAPFARHPMLDARILTVTLLWPSLIDASGTIVLRPLLNFVGLCAGRITPSVQCFKGGKWIHVRAFISWFTLSVNHCIIVSDICLFP